MYFPPWTAATHYRKIKSNNITLYSPQACIPRVTPCGIMYCFPVSHAVCQSVWQSMLLPAPYAVCHSVWHSVIPPTLSVTRCGTV